MSGFREVVIRLIWIITLAFLVMGLLLFSWEASAATTYNVKDYGAVGDGVHDDTAAIQAAINACSVRGTVYFPSGNYRLVLVGSGEAKYALQLKSNITFMMDGAAELKLDANSETHYKILKLDTLTNVNMSGGTITGDRETHTGGGEWGFGIRMNNCKNVTVDGVKIQKCWGDGIYVEGTDGTTSQNVTVKNCIADRNRRQGFSIIDLNGGSITGNTISNTLGTTPEAGIDLEPNDVGQVVQNVNISGNTFTGNGTGVATGGYSGKVSGNTISNNTISSSVHDGFWIDASQNCTISSNTVTGNGSKGMKLMGCTGLTVTGNQISSNADAGILLTKAYDSSDVSSGCVVKNNSISSTQSGIQLLDGSTLNTVSGNYMWQISWKAIYQDGSSTNNTIEHNTFPIPDRAEWKSTIAIIAGFGLTLVILSFVVVLAVRSQQRSGSP